MSEPQAHSVQQSHVAGTGVVAPPMWLMPEQEQVQQQADQAPDIETQLRELTPDERAQYQENLALGMNKGDAMDLALEVAATGLPIPGAQAISMGLMLPFSWWAADRTAAKALSDMTEQNRDIIAEKCGCEPEEVTDRMTLQASRKHPELASALQNIVEEKDAHPWKNAVGVGGMFAGAGLAGALAPVTGGFSLIGMIPALAGGFLGYEVGDEVGNRLFNPSASSNSRKIMESLQEKKAEGQTISPSDVFALRVAQNKQLAETIEFRLGEPYHKLEPAEQQQVMRACAPIHMQCMRDAVLANQEGANINYLMWGAMPEPQQAKGAWQQRVASQQRVPQQGQWADTVRAGQAAQHTEQEAVR